QDAKAVLVSAQLARRSPRALTIFGYDLAHRHSELQSMYRQLSFDFESGCQCWKALDKAAREYTVPRKQIGQSVAEKGSHQAGEHAIPQAMATAVCILSRGTTHA